MICPTLVAMRVSRLSSQLDSASVELSALPAHAPALLPDACACCAAPATQRVALGRKGGTALLVGYCEACAEHQGDTAARVLALSLASLLLAIVAAAGLPLLDPWLGLAWLALAVCGVSALPLLALLLRRAAPSAPHSAHGPAVFWRRAGCLQCASPAYAERLAELNGGTVQRQPRREQNASAWASVGPVVGLGAACLSFFVYHPLLRILNLGAQRVEVAVGDRVVARIEPTSNESPMAGALLRVPAGEHVLTVRSSVDGSALARTRASFHSGAVHLFAFGAEETCFWLETAGYGREQRGEPSIQPLFGSGQFWVLPGGIDTWFAPNPSGSLANTRSSGGLLTALRQAPCTEAPREVRSARQFASP